MQKIKKGKSAKELLRDMREFAVMQTIFNDECNARYLSDYGKPITLSEKNRKLKEQCERIEKANFVKESKKAVKKALKQ